MATTFKNPNDPDNIIITAKVHEWVRAKMNLSDDVLVQVIEVDCSDPGCMNKETRILVTKSDTGMKQYRVHKPLVYVRPADIDYLLKNI